MITGKGIFQLNFFSRFSRFDLAMIRLSRVILNRNKAAKDAGPQKSTFKDVRNFILIGGGGIYIGNMAYNYATDSQLKREQSIMDSSSRTLIRSHAVARSKHDSSNFDEKAYKEFQKKNKVDLENLDKKIDEAKRFDKDGKNLAVSAYNEALDEGLKKSSYQDRNITWVYGMQEVGKLEERSFNSKRKNIATGNSWENQVWSTYRPAHVKEEIRLKEEERRKEAREKFEKEKELGINPSIALDIKG